MTVPVGNDKLRQSVYDIVRTLSTPGGYDRVAVAVEMCRAMMVRSFFTCSGSRRSGVSLPSVLFWFGCACQFGACRLQESGFDDVVDDSLKRFFVANLNDTYHATRYFTPDVDQGSLPYLTATVVVQFLQQTPTRYCDVWAAALSAPSE